ncbi:MAG: hypothetical protein ACJAXJ_000210 [Colwellia sp.]|jgi:hypothetical protein
MKKISVLAFVLCLFSENAFAETHWKNEQDLGFEIYDIFLDDGTLLFESDDIFIHQDKILLPFESIVATLEFNISYHTKNKIIKGKLYDKLLNIPLMQDNDISTTIYTTLFNGQLYIDSATLGKIIDAEVIINHQQLKVTLRPNHILFPLQKRLLRSDNAVVKQHRNQQDTYGFIIDDQYRPFTMPSGSVSLAMQKTVDEQQITANINLFNDVLYHASNLSLSTDSDGNTTRRWTLGRNEVNPNDKIIGGINRYAFGDVSVSTPNGRSSLSGVGMTFSSSEDKYGNSFGNITLDEFATPNWQAELYQNGFLIDRGVVGSDGRIVFKDLETQYGTNRFEIKTFGPHGEEASLIRNILIGSNLLKPGEIKYQGAVLDTNHSFINQDTSIFNSDIDNAPVLFVQSSYGFSDNTSLQFSLFTKDNKQIGEKLTEATFTSTHQLNNALLNFYLKGRNNDSYDFESQIIGRLGSFTSYNSSLTYFKNSATGTESPKSDKYGFNAGFTSRFNTLSYGIQVRHNQEDSVIANIISDLETNNIDARLSWRFFNVNLQNTLTYGNASYGDITNDYLRDQLSVSMPISNNINFRASANFDLDSKSEQRLTSTDISVNGYFDNGLSNSTFISYRSSKDYRVNNNLSLPLDSLNLTFGASYSANESLGKEWGVSLGISFNLDYDYHKNKINMSSQYSPASGTLDLFTFIDNNKNAKFDEYDEALPNVHFGSAPQWETTSTGKNGTAYLTGVGSNNATRVYFDTQETKSPQLTPVYDDFRFYTHAGGVVSLDIPFNYNTAVEGNVVHKTKENAFLGFIPIQLLDKSGVVVAEMNTDRDGYYSFDKAWRGHYTLRIEPGYLTTKGNTVSPSSHDINLTGIDEFITLDNFVIAKPVLNTIVFEPKIDIVPVKISTDKNKKTVSTIVSNKNIVTAPSPAKKKEIGVIEVNTNKPFTIQIGAFSNPLSCEQKSAQLEKQLSLTAFNKKQGKLCKVYIGYFSTKEEAVKMLKNLPKNITRGAYVTRY